MKTYLLQKPDIYLDGKVVDHSDEENPIIIVKDPLLSPDRIPSEGLISVGSAGYVRFLSPRLVRRLRWWEVILVGLGVMKWKI